MTAGKPLRDLIQMRLGHHAQMMLD